MADTIESLLSERGQLKAELEACRHVDSWANQRCDAADAPKAPANESSIAWRVDWLIEERARLTAEVERIKQERADVLKLELWIDSDRPAHLHFTEGPERRVADVIEYYRAELTLTKTRLSAVLATCGKQEARIVELERTLQEMPDEQVSAWQLGAKLLAAQNRIAELERERDIERASKEDWRGLSEKIQASLEKTQQSLTARNAELTTDLETHMRLVRTMGERCDVLGGLLGEWRAFSAWAADLSDDVRRLREKTERALSQETRG